MNSSGASGDDSLGGKPRAIELTSHDSEDEQISLQPSMIRSLDEVKGAFETEAESHILQAIEEAENEYEDESAADSRPSLLDGVPSHAAHLFSHLLEKPSPTFSNATPIDPFEPNMGKPRLKDVANRMRMMQMATKMRSQRGLNVNSESNQENVPYGDQAAQDTIDPESLENGDNTGHGSDFDTNPSMVRDTSRATKTFYRRHCAPCYTFTNFLKVRWTDIKYQVMMVIYLMVPCLGVAAILYYWTDNPEGPYNSSYSWWLIFIVRLSVTRLLAQLSQFILIDFICLETRLAVMSVGRMLTLMAVQAKGWPLVSVLWAAWNLSILLGRANSHWLSMQTFFDIFNSNNYGGDFLVSDTYRRILAAVFIVGFVVMVKRVCIALVLGKRTYVSFGHSMERMMQKVLLIGEVAMLAEEIEFAANNGNASMAVSSMKRSSPTNKWLFTKYTSNRDVKDGEDEDELLDEGMRKDDELYEVEGMHDNVASDEEGKTESKPFAWMRFHKAKKDAVMKDSDKELIATLLGEWEEPELKRKSSFKDVSVRKILQFREALDYLDGIYPLSVPFGNASTRKDCMESSQKIYRRLLTKTPESPILHFDTLMTLAVDKHGKLNKEKARSLIRLFRPDRQGYLTLLDFVKSCDKIYKKVKIFRVAIYNAVQLDTAVETIFNVLFYLLLGIIIASSLAAIDPFALFSSMIAFFLPLSFLFSAAASKYFEGLLLVLLRQPYNIGDRIAVSNPMVDTPPDGSTTWFVEGITLFHTTVRCAGTNEVGTYNNGSLAPLRIINAARSPKAFVTVKLKLGIDVAYEKIKVFGTVIENFVKERPREWIKLCAFRSTVVEADLGYVGYIVVLNHVESWQNIGAIKQSLADCASFCLEVSKKLDMRFVAPPMPIDLRIDNRDAVQTSLNADLGEGHDDGISMIQKLFSKPPEPTTATKKKN